MRRANDAVRYERDHRLARDPVSPWHQWAQERIAEAVSTDGAGVNVVVTKNRLSAMIQAELGYELF